MLGNLSTALAIVGTNAYPAAPLLGPAVILILCVLAGIGTTLLLPKRQEGSIRKIGGALLIAAGLIFAALLARASFGSGEDGAGVYFWIFSAIALLGAARVVTHPRPVYSALYFVLTVFATAGLFVLLWAEFMAAALVLIYAGAILITYVFVIMLAASAQSGESQSPLAGLGDYDVNSREPMVAAIVGFTLMGVLLFVIFDKAEGLAPHGATAAQAIANLATTPETAGVAPAAAPPATPADASMNGNTQALGAYLFQDQLVNLEIAGLILTLGMVGAIVIARKRVINPADAYEPSAETINATMTPVDDNPNSIPVYGTMNPRQKAFPET